MQSFRPDLEERVQALAIDRHRRQRLHDLSMSSWRETLASKQSHTAMLCSLVQEAHRQSPARIPSCVVTALLRFVHCSQNGLDPLQPIPKGGFAPPARPTEDKYVTLLEKLSKLDLFRRVHTIATLKDAGIPCCASISVAPRRAAATAAAAAPRQSVVDLRAKQQQDVLEEDDDDVEAAEDVATQRARSSLERSTMMKQTL